MSIEIDYGLLERLKQDLVSTMAELSEVTRNSYIVQDMFPQSEAASAEATNATRDGLVQCAEMMEDIFHNAIVYFEKIITDFKAADIESAVEALKLSDDRNAPVNRPKPKP